MNGPRATIDGVYPAGVTAFAADGSIDHGAYAEHMAWLIERGVDGVVAFGTNGEGPLIGPSEKLRALELLCKRLPPASIIATVAQASLPDALAALHALNELPLRAVLVLPPYYFKPAANAGLMRFFEPIAAASHHPIVLYHIPKYALALPPEVVTALPVWGVKDSGAEIAYTRTIVAAGKGVLLGTEDDVFTRLQTGANGLISALANFIPEAIVRVNRLAREGREAEGRELAALLAQVRVASKACGIAGLKRLAERRHGVRLGGVRPPLEPAPPEYDGSAVFALLDAAGAAVQPVR